METNMEKNDYHLNSSETNLNRNQQASMRSNLSLESHTPISLSTILEKNKEQHELTSEKQEFKTNIDTTKSSSSDTNVSSKISAHTVYNVFESGRSEISYDEAAGTRYYNRIKYYLVKI